MKSYPPSPLLLALSGLAALSSFGCSDPKPRSAAITASTVPAVPVVDPLATAPTTPAPATAIHAEWSDIQELGYDERTDFVAGLGRLHAKLDKQIADLKSRRAGLAAGRDPAPGDAAIEILGTARTRLLSASTDMGKATPANWSQRRERVGDAWVNAQNAHAKADAAVFR